MNPCAILAAASLSILAGWAGERTIPTPQVVLVSTNTGAGLATNFFWFRPMGSNQPAKAWRLPPAGPAMVEAWTLPAPGVYTAEPYKLIVVVPGPQVDDKCIAGPNPQRQPQIRQASPELRLVPREPAKR